MNTVFLIGRLTSDVEIVRAGEYDIARICIAVERDFKNSEGSYDVDFIYATLWEGVAKYASDTCKKGTAIILKGRLASSSYEKDDKKVTKLEVIADSIALCPKNRIKEAEE